MANDKRGGARPNTGNRYIIEPKTQISLRVKDTIIEASGGKNAFTLKLYELISNNF